VVGFFKGWFSLQRNAFKKKRCFSFDGKRKVKRKTDKCNGKKN
jgi:hypothetical protein